ncbi:hypothetical protein R3P38DRAFT_1679647 [Favolaschia claudopus]|uniref:Uncharacterized protein n=1 Tax=Favolaschia claudopus TaxID=2862362 RepID=A0AAW0ACM5_9AGAR
MHSAPSFSGSLGNPAPPSNSYPYSPPHAMRSLLLLFHHLPSLRRRRHVKPKYWTSPPLSFLSPPSPAPLHQSLPSFSRLTPNQINTTTTLLIDTGIHRHFLAYSLSAILLFPSCHSVLSSVYHHPSLFLPIISYQTHTCKRLSSRKSERGTLTLSTPSDDCTRRPTALRLSRRCRRTSSVLATSAPEPEGQNRPLRRKPPPYLYSFSFSPPLSGLDITSPYLSILPTPEDIDNNPPPPRHCSPVESESTYIVDIVVKALSL